MSTFIQNYMELYFQIIKLQTLHWVKQTIFIVELIDQICTHIQSFKWNATCAGGSGGLAKVNSLMCSITENFLLHITDQQLRNQKQYCGIQIFLHEFYHLHWNNFFWSASAEKPALREGRSKTSLKLLMNIDWPSNL